MMRDACYDARKLTIGTIGRVYGYHVYCGLCAQFVCDGCTRRPMSHAKVTDIATRHWKGQHGNGS
jgi:hypothetical protein